MTSVALPRSLDVGSAPAVAEIAYLLRDRAEGIRQEKLWSKDAPTLRRRAQDVGFVLEALEGLREAVLCLAETEDSPSAQDAYYDARDVVLGVMGEVQTMRLDLQRRAAKLEEASA